MFGRALLGAARQAFNGPLALREYCVISRAFRQDRHGRNPHGDIPCVIRCLALKAIFETSGALPAQKRDLFEELVPPWLSQREKYPHTVVATAAHTIRLRSKHSKNARTAANLSARTTCARPAAFITAVK